MDYGDWICLQCGAYRYVGLYQQGPSPTERLLRLPAVLGRDRRGASLPDLASAVPGSNTRKTFLGGRAHQTCGSMAAAR